MKKLIITIEEDFGIAKEILKGYQFWAYQISMKSLLALIYTAVGKYKVTKVNKITTFTEEGDPDYIDLELKRFENFMFGDEEELRKDKYQKFKKAVNDRWLGRVKRNAHKHKSKIKDKAVRAALGGTDIFGFFTKLGIFIKWKVVKA